MESKSKQNEKDHQMTIELQKRLELFSEKLNAKAIELDKRESNLSKNIEEK